jgi:hypothetical protein
VVGEGLRQKYFAPTASRRLAMGQPYGFEAEFLMRKYFGIAIGIRHQVAGQNTATRQVMFSDDLYVHEFQSTAEISYLCAPLVLKAGISQSTFWAFARFGCAGLIAMNKNLSWQIDGKMVSPGSNRMPAVTVQPTTTTYLLGIEAGIKHGNNGVFLVGDLSQGRRSLTYGLPGTAIAQVAEFSGGYRRFF